VEGRRWLIYLVEVLVLAAALSVGILVRLRSAEVSGVKLTADDPLLHYRITKRLLEIGRIPNYDQLAWHPWSYDPRRRLPPLHYYFAAGIYEISRLLGLSDDLYTVMVLMPAFFAPLAVIPIYFAVREMWGSRLGAATAAFGLAGTWAYAQRSVAGFNRHEQLAIPFLSLSFMATTMALKDIEEKSWWRVLLLTWLSSAALVVAEGLWAGFRLLYDGYPLFLMLLVLMKRASRKHEAALLIPSCFALGASLSTYPHLNTIIPFWSSGESVVLYAAIVLAVVYEFWPEKRTKVDKRLGALIVLALVGVAAITTGVSMKRRFLKVLNPGAEFHRGAVVETVAEHMTEPGRALTSIGMLLVPASVGFVLLLIERRFEEENLLSILMALTTFYFSMTFIRLPPLAAPFLSVVAGYAGKRVGDFFGNRLADIERIRRYARRKRRGVSTGRILRSLAAPTILFILLVGGPVAKACLDTWGLAGYYTLGFTEGWYSALDWIEENTSEDDVLISWWDYGYWIGTVNRTTLADGLTINETQIREIARAFIGPEERMLDLAMRFNASYVVVDIAGEVCGGGTCLTGGGKWLAMAWIAMEFERNPFRDRDFWRTDLPKFFSVNPVTGIGSPTAYAQNLTLFKMAMTALGGQNAGLRYFRLEHIGRTGDFPNVAIFSVDRGGP